MERRVLLAAVLSAVVVIVWFAVFTPPQAKAPAATATPAAVESAVPAELGERKTETPQATPSPSTPKPVAVAGAVDEEIVVEGQGLRATVATRGGLVRSLVLPEYKDREGRPRELVRVGTASPLSFAAPGKWNTDLYQVERSGGELTLRWSDGQGNWAEKKIAAGAGRFALEVGVRSGGVPALSGVVVATSIAEGEEDFGQFRTSNTVVRVGGKLERVAPAKIEGEQRIGGLAEFAGAESRYFLTALLPTGRVEARLARVTGAAAKEEAATVVLNGQDGTVAGTLVAGAKEHGTLKGYGRGLEETVSFGFFGFLAVGFLAAMRWIHAWAGNWGVAIIVLTAGIRLLLFPLNHKSAVAMKRMQVLQPKMKAIQDRYQDRAKKDMQVRNRMNQEIMALYKQEGVNPMGGCLPILIQLPILWALYSLFGYAVELRQAPLAFWLKDLSLKDPTYITPILMTATMVWQQKITPQVGDPAQRRMFMLMPFIFGFMFINFPAGLVLYWLVNNLFTIGQQVLTNRLLANGAAPK